MKIIKATYNNFRNVPDGEYDLNGKNFFLIAENTKGKSNFIKGAMATWTGNVGVNAIRNGENEAEVQTLMAEFGKDGIPIDGTEYTFKMKIKKDKSGDEKVSMEVTAPNGFKEVKKTVIGTIVGEMELDFDFVALSKTAAGKKKQIEIIKSYFDDETKKALSVWENKCKMAYEDRTEAGRQLKMYEGSVKNSGLTAAEVKQYAEKKDISAIQEQIKLATDNNLLIQGAKDRLEERVIDVAKNIKEIADLMSKAEALKLENIALEKKNKDAQTWLLENTVTDISALQAEVQLASTHNEIHQKVLAMQSSIKQRDFYSEQYGELGALVDSSKQAIQDTIKQMEMPVTGISFDEDNLYYKGKLVDENNMSKAEIMLLEAELKMSKNPGVQVLFVQEGESIGLKLLKELCHEAEKRGFMLGVENVVRGEESLRIEMMPEY